MHKHNRKMATRNQRVSRLTGLEYRGLEYWVLELLAMPEGPHL